MSRETLRAYHVTAALKLRSYADDSGLRDSDVKHYRKRAEFHDEMVSTIDTLPDPLHPHNDGLDEYRKPIQLRDMDPEQRLALARGEL